MIVDWSVVIFFLGFHGLGGGGVCFSPPNIEFKASRYHEMSSTGFQDTLQHRTILTC